MSAADALLREARRTRDRLITLQHEVELAQVDYQHLIRRLHAGGSSLREIGETLGLSHQRVHQIIDLSAGKGAVATVKPESPDSTHCSFCGAEQAEAGRLVAGPRVTICSRCVELAHELDSGGARAGAELHLVPVGLDRPKSRCRYCGRRREQTGGMAEAPFGAAAGKFSRREAGARICTTCTRLCKEILAEELPGLAR